jgi:hypothetical protein
MQARTEQYIFQIKFEAETFYETLKLVEKPPSIYQSQNFSNQLLARKIVLMGLSMGHRDSCCDLSGNRIIQFAHSIIGLRLEIRVTH